jgi:hypothetical protein
VVRRVTVAAVLVLVLVAGACSGDDDSDNGAGPTDRTTATTADAKSDWAPADVARARSLALRLQKAAPGQCADVQLLPRATYLVVAKRLDVEPAAAVADCDVYGETVEFSVFGSAAERDAYVRARTLALCKVAKKSKANVPALHWALGDGYSVQFVHEGAAKNVAEGLGGQYELVKCPGETDVTWTAAGEARVDQLVKQLQARPAVQCSADQLLDYPHYKSDVQYKDRLPSAYLQCAGRGNTVIYVAAFDPGSDVTPAKFIAGETRMLCNGGRNIAAVEGDDFAIIATNVSVAAQAAAATGGQALPAAC